MIDPSDQTLTLETTTQHPCEKTNSTTTTKQATTTAKTATYSSTFIPEDYWDCIVFYNNFTGMSQIGDGICDDYLNHVYCQYDGGDCCLQDIVTSACSICTCFDDESCNILLHSNLTSF